jgi:DNA-binding MarR family transcriptional regulator
MKGDGPRLEDFQYAAELRSALRHFLRSSEQVARKHRLTPQRYTLLLMIKGAPDGSQRSTVTELSRRLQLAQSTVTELVRRAEHVGLIAREPSATDGRVAYLRITPEGERRLAGTVRDLGLEQRRLGAVLGENHPSRSRR